MIVGWMKLTEVCEGEICSLTERKIQSKRNSLVGKEILYKLMLEHYGIDLSLEENPIGKMAMGKPYFINHPHIHFNISHSKDVVACVIADSPVGIDVQYCEAKNIQMIAEKILTFEEGKIFQESGFRDEIFFKYWAKKESYLKFIGEGIRRDLRKMTYEGARFYEWEPYSGYVGMVCVSEKRIDGEQIINNVLENKSRYNEYVCVMKKD